MFNDPLINRISFNLIQQSLTDMASQKKKKHERCHGAHRGPAPWLSWRRS